MVKNINIHDFTAVLADDILSSLYLLDADYISKNTYSSAKMSMDDISKCYIKNFIRGNYEISGQWSFKSEISCSLENIIYDKSLVQITYLAKAQGALSSAYNNLLSSLFIFGKMPSYTGMVVATSLSSQALVKNRFGGRTWKMIASERFIVGAGSGVSYGIPSSNNDGKDFIKLTKDQVGLPKHKHDFGGGSFSGHGNIKRGNAITCQIKTTYHNTKGASRPGYSPWYLRDKVKGRMATTSQNYNFGGKTVKNTVKNTAEVEFDNRPFYIPIYFWERTS